MPAHECHCSISVPRYLPRYLHGSGLSIRGAGVCTRCWGLCVITLVAAGGHTDGRCWCFSPVPRLTVACVVCWIHNTGTEHQQYDYALHHYLSVGGKDGIYDNTTWSTKRAQYQSVLRGTAAKQPAQLVTVLRDPLSAFFSKYRYFNLRRKVGTVKEVMALPSQGDGQTADIGLHSFHDLDTFMIHEFQSGFFMVIEELALSLAIWKLLCDIPWHEVVALHVNDRTMEPNENDRKKEQLRRGLVESKHVKDYRLYTAARDKLTAAAADYPDQALLRSTVGRISRVNAAFDNICNVHVNTSKYKSEFSGPCKMMSMKPMQFAQTLSPDTGGVDRSAQLLNEGGFRSTVGSALDQLKILANSHRVLQYVPTTAAKDRVDKRDEDRLQEAK